MRGWLAEIRRHHDLHRQIAPYAKLQRQVEAFADWIILPWDADSAALFVKLRRQGLRIGSLDLKVACTALAHDSTVLINGDLKMESSQGNAPCNKTFCRRVRSLARSLDIEIGPPCRSSTGLGGFATTT